MNHLTTIQLRQYAEGFARALLPNEAGKVRGYWEKPLLGRPRVPGGAYVLGTYAYFISGCALAGACDVSNPTPALRDAESLASYYVNHPNVRQVMDAHWKESDDYAAKNLSPEMREMIGVNARTLITQSGFGRADESELNIFWEIIRQQGKFSIDQGISGFATFLEYGASLDPAEVQRLWGIQVSASPMPTLDVPFLQAQAEALAMADELIGTRQ
jgi:hypothetical protein